MRVNNYYNSYYGVVSRETAPIEPQLFCDVSDDLISTIFAPSPENGFPSNALSFVLNKNTAREVQEFIKDNLLKVLPPRSGAPDDETAESTLRVNSEQYGTEIDNYYNRLSEFLNSVESDNDESSE